MFVCVCVCVNYKHEIVKVYTQIQSEGGGKKGKKFVEKTSLKKEPTTQQE